MSARTAFAALSALVAVLLATTAAHAADWQSTVRNMLEADVREAQVAVLIVDADTGEELARFAPDEPMIPASNMKLVTTAAALRILGPDFVFRTELGAIRGESDATANLLVRGDGDPAFGDPKLLEMHQLDVEQLIQAWVTAVREAGIREVPRLIIDDRVFDDQFVHPSWPANQLNAWYCAQVAGLNFHDNCLDLYPEPAGTGQAARVRTSPAAPFLIVSNRAVSISSKDKAEHNFLVHRKPGGNELTYSGKVKVRPTRPVNVTVDDPPMFFAQVFAHRLAAAGIRVGAITRPGAGEQLPAHQPLHLVQTTLPLVLQRCNKDSQNLFAEALIKRMGRKVTGAPGSWENGGAAIRMYLAEQFGSRGAAVSIADGSGMSRDNRVTARLLVDILCAMHRDPQLGPIYRESLSIAGEDGTLARRFDGPDSRCTIAAKSGYIAGVSTLSGYVILPPATGAGSGVGASGGRTIAFSFLFNNFKPASFGDIRQLQEKLIKMIDRELSPTEPVRMGG